jgi:hypothetical protein
MADFELVPATAPGTDIPAWSYTLPSLSNPLRNCGSPTGALRPLGVTETVWVTGWPAGPGAVPCEYIVAPGLGARPSQERTA